MAIQWKIFLFLERGVHSKNKQQLLPHFSLNKFFDRIFFDNYFWNPQDRSVR